MRGGVLASVVLLSIGLQVNGTDALAEDIWFGNEIKVQPAGGTNTIAVSGKDFSARKVEGAKAPSWAYAIQFTSVPKGSPLKVGETYYVSQKYFKEVQKVPAGPPPPKPDFWFGSQVKVLPAGGTGEIPIEGAQYPVRKLKVTSPSWTVPIEFTSVPPGSSVETGRIYFVSKKYYEAAEKNKLSGGDLPIPRAVSPPPPPPPPPAPPVKRIVVASVEVELIPNEEPQPVQRLPIQTLANLPVLINKQVTPNPICVTSIPPAVPVPSVQPVFEPVPPKEPEKKNENLLEAKRTPYDKSWTFKAADDFVREANFNQPLKVISRKEWGAQAPLEQLEPLGPVEGIVIHHAESAMNWDIKSLETDHIGRKPKGRGFPTLGYQYVIALNPKTGDWDVFEGGPGGKKLTHVPQNNTGKIGICIMGSYHSRIPGIPFGYQKGAHESQMQPMKGAMEKLGQLINKIKQENPTVKYVAGHGHGDHAVVRGIQGKKVVDQKPCPGEGCQHMIHAFRTKFGLTAPFKSRWNDNGVWKEHSSEEYQRAGESK